jgi:hypothetical protein
MRIKTVVREKPRMGRYPFNLLAVAWPCCRRIKQYA